MYSMDIITIPTDEAVREVENKFLGVEKNITDWQMKQNRNNNNQDQQRKRRIF